MIHIFILFTNLKYRFILFYMDVIRRNFITVFLRPLLISMEISGMSRILARSGGKSSIPLNCILMLTLWAYMFTSVPWLFSKTDKVRLSDTVSLILKFIQDLYSWAIIFFFLTNTTKHENNVVNLCG